jgi:hypothetical protein
MIRQGAVKLLSSLYLEGKRDVSLFDVPGELLMGVTQREIEKEGRRRKEQNRRLRAEFWTKNPPSPLTKAPNIQTESELFDILAHYHIAKVECIFDMCWYPWDDFGTIMDSTIKAWLPSGIEIDLYSELPNDEHDEEEEGIGDAIGDAIQSPNDDHDEEQSIAEAFWQVIRKSVAQTKANIERRDRGEPDGDESDGHKPDHEEQGIGDAICEAIHELASALPTAGRFQGGKAIFDVQDRRIYLHGTVEVTTEEGFEKA